MGWSAGVSDTAEGDGVGHVWDAVKVFDCMREFACRYQIDYNYQLASR